jgi:hypothetical protein
MLFFSAATAGLQEIYGFGISQAFLTSSTQLQNTPDVGL